MMVDMSTPMTCFAPAFTANLNGKYQRLHAGAVGGCRAFEHAEDGCTASDIEDDLVLEQVPVLID
jgi:hypothetical protein